MNLNVYVWLPGTGSNTNLTGFSNIVNIDFTKSLRSPKTSKAGLWFKIGKKFYDPQSEVHQDHDLGVRIAGN
jgi:hypothetical protein